MTGRIYEHLCAELNADSVFKDVANIPYGSDFRNTIRAALKKSDVLLAVIGPDWLRVHADSGKVRTDEETDYVYFEIETAISSGLRVIPVLVRGTAMPRAADLPETIRSLAHCNAAPIRPDPDFVNDINKLILSIVGRQISTDRRLTSNRITRLFRNAQLPLAFAVSVSIGVASLVVMSMDMVVFTGNWAIADIEAMGGKRPSNVPSGAGLRFWIALSSFLGSFIWYQWLVHKKWRARKVE